MWIDTHAHLFDCSAHELETVLTAAVNTGVGAVISTATSCSNAPTVVGQSSAYPLVWAAVGVSPFDVDSVSENWAVELAELCSHPKVVAVGEIGIDATNPAYPPLEKQLPLFEMQLEVAKKSALPVVIHSRGVEEQAAAVCRTNGVSDALFHCFTGSRKAMAAVIENGYYISLSGIVTFKNFSLREYIRDIPLNRLLIETDCPYLAPVPFRGKQNQPAWVKYVGEEVARLYDISPIALALQLEENFRLLFKKFDVESKMQVKNKE